jgi:serine/threonine-protein kinase
MMSANRRAPFRVAGGSDPHPSTSEAARAFLQQRFGVFGQAGFFLSFGFYFLFNLLSISGQKDGLYWLTGLPNLLNLILTGVFAFFWWISKWGPLGMKTLRVLEVTGTVTLCGLTTGYGWLGNLFEHWELNTLLAAGNVLVFRAVIIPSAPTRTLWISCLAALPGMVPAFVSYFHPRAGADPRTLELEMALFAGWSFIAVGVSTVVSRIIYGLERKVREAEQLGQYRLEEKIGEGGMGEVYRASHALLRRPTAIKLLRPEKAGRESIARFEREVQLTSRLTHPNTISIYDYGQTPDGVFYYAMEYLPGLNLDSLIQTSGPLPPGRVIHILRQVCASLIEAHAVGLVHRDIKAANIILCQRGGVGDVVKVVDFGLVKRMDRSTDVTSSGSSGANAITGTPFYMSPESIRSPEEVDARSDIYSLGIVGYFLLSGKVPFDSGTVLEICSHHLRTPPIKPSLRVDRPIPEDLEQLILACLEKQPGQRPQSAQLLQDALGGLKDAGGWSPVDVRAWWSGYAGGKAAAARAVAPTATHAALKDGVEDEARALQ